MGLRFSIDLNMANGIATVILGILFYAVLLLLQQWRRKQKLTWRQLTTKGDPWFFPNLLVAQMAAILLSPRVVAWV